MNKELIRKIMFPISIITGAGYFQATEDTLWCKFLMWLYGYDEMGIEE